MQCPVDGTTLVMADRGGVEIDYCPQCRGVWLDRGELDKIIERSAAAPAPAPREASYEDRRPERRDFDDRGHRDRDDDDYRHGQKGYRKKRKESFLGDLFDF
jgi:Zn-finger nucleic acid-binding protein